MENKSTNKPPIKEKKVGFLRFTMSDNNQELALIVILYFVVFWFIWLTLTLKCEGLIK